ncbi:MAG: NAD+ synthase [Bacteroidales bacterium]|nr:NAD+ synthase [Bacteroidales bacterium]
MKITIAQLNYHVGNFNANTEKSIRIIRDAAAEGSDLVVFPELSVTGYPPSDLLERRDFIEECENAVDRIKEECREIAAIIGVPTINRTSSGKRLFNSACFIENGEVKQVINKTLLPTYDVFDEYRYFEPSNDFALVSYRGKKLAVTICEDLWDEQGFDNSFAPRRLYTHSPMEELARMNPDIIINISASPFSARRTEMKKRVFTGKAQRYNLPLFMANQTGANTELIFDGGSMVISPDGRIYDHLGFFTENVRSYDTDKIIMGHTPEPAYGEGYIEMIYKALLTGVRDYFGKSGLTTAITGLSGGIDSAVVTALAAEALGTKSVRALLLPSMWSSEHSLTDAIELAGNLGIRYDVVHIADSYNAVTESLKPLFDDLPEDVTEENIQARVRAVMLMALSNKFGNILLNTSNKSESAVGYGTLYGDMAGGLSVIGDLYKTDVYALARYINRNGIIIPERTIQKPPSAELRPGQLDTDSLPQYDILDSIIYQYIELQTPAENIEGNGISPSIVNKVIRMINASEHKRFQSPPVLRISSKSFGPGRRIPLVAKQ